MLHELKEASTSHLYPIRVLSDFEKSPMVAFEEEFPGVTIKGWHFELTQSLLRKIQELGLASEYKDNSNLRSWFDLFKGLTFVTLNLITLAFNFIISLEP